MIPPETTWNWSPRPFGPESFGGAPEGRAMEFLNYTIPTVVAYMRVASKTLHWEAAVNYRAYMTFRDGRGLTWQRDVHGRLSRTVRMSVIPAHPPRIPEPPAENHPPRPAHQNPHHPDQDAHPAPRTTSPPTDTTSARTPLPKPRQGRLNDKLRELGPGHAPRGCCSGGGGRIGNLRSLDEWAGSPLAESRHTAEVPGGHHAARRHP